MESMVVKLKKDILLGILFLNGLVENGLAEESTAASIVSGLLSTASGIVAKNDEASAAVQQPNSSQVGEPQSIIPEQSDSMLNAPSESSSPENTTVSDISSLGIQNETSQFGVNDSSVNSERGSENLSKKVGFIDKDGNVFVPPESTIFPAEMQDGKIYFFSKDVYALKEKLKKNIKTPAPNTLNNPMNPLSNMTTAGNGETPGANMMGNANEKNRNESGKKPIMFQCYLA
ncbi:MAG: hypothetical protein LBI95_00500 [Holosporales bacterium]|jgi:hypothetical protein|nr:hypothetical protein [Holosporales bacterium]